MYADILYGTEGRIPYPQRSPGPQDTDVSTSNLLFQKMFCPVLTAIARDFQQVNYYKDIGKIQVTLYRLFLSSLR